ncbi:MAG: hypothetical protein KKE62_16120 [Proteobacteria bacterium]|nr:hypothetical protein [Pseudomonadota bacterium]MBU1544356.1 hypothetical protein [Pseudomonadota bacterium]
MHPFIAKYLFYCLEFLRRENVFSFLKELEKNQYLSKSEISVLQKEKLNKLLKSVMSENSYYKRKYRGYDPIVDFASLPILTKEELRENYKALVTNKNQKYMDMVETSGSTGIPLQFYRDRVIFGYTLASLYRGHRWWGIDIGSKEAMLWGVPVSYKNRLKVKLKDIVLNRFRERAYNVNVDTLLDFYKKIQRKRPVYLFGYSSMVYEFAIFVEQMGLIGQDLYLKNIICTAEKINSFQKKKIEDIFGCKVISEYGATEAGILSFECPMGCNHISDDCVYVEIVDEKNNPVPDGKEGRVLVTVLHSFSSPIIRYDLGDIACKSTVNCSCGINLSSLEKIIGRTSDVVVTPHGQTYHSIVFYYFIKDFMEKHGGIKQFKVRQVAIDKLEFHFVIDHSSKKKIELYIKKQVLDKFGSDMKVAFIYHDYISRERSGKLRDFETVLDVALYKTNCSLKGN